MAENSLILQNPREKIFTKIESSKKRKSVAEKEQLLKDSKESFCYAFIASAWRILKFRPDELNCLSIKELIELESLIYPKVKRLVLLQTLCLVFIPLIGWLLLREIIYQYIGPNSLRTTARSQYYHSYIWTRKVLRKAYGNDYFPFESLILALPNFLKQYPNLESWSDIGIPQWYSLTG